MRKYKILIDIQIHKLNEKSLCLAKLQQKHQLLNNELKNQYQSCDDAYFYMDAIHFRSQYLTQQIHVLNKKIAKIKIEIQNYLYEKKKMEKALEYHIQRAKQHAHKKEVVNMDNIATINYLIKNVFK